jgi:hypothetical protein
MSTLNVANVTDGTTSVPTGYVVNGSAKCWVHGDMPNSTINDSLNTSSMTDEGTGQFLTNWTSAFSNTYYSYYGTDYFYGLLRSNQSGWTTSSAYVITYGGSFVARDNVFTTAAHGDLA